jgi:hypothetical protein
MQEAFDPGPIIGVRLYRRDVVTVRQGRAPGAALDAATKRSDIMQFSYKSRKRLAFIVNNTRVTFVTMITLTYPSEFPCDGDVVKRHLNTFLTWLRKRCDRPSYVWFLEFQKRGAPHVHILIDYPLPREEDPRVDLFYTIARRWYEIVGSGDERHRAAGTRTERIRKPDGAARYALKYCYKMEQKAVPPGYRNVGRFWGCSRDVPPDEPRMIPMDEPVLRSIIADWEFSPDADTLVYQTLFGQADRFRSYSGVQAYLALDDIVSV